MNEGLRRLRLEWYPVTCWHLPAAAKLTKLLATGRPGMRTGRPGIRRTAAVLLCLVFAVSASAQEIRGPYIGVGAGLLSYEEDGDSGIRISDGGSIYRLVGGYQLNSNYAIEASWARSTDIKEQLYLVDTMGNLVTLDLGLEAKITTLRVLALAPFSGLSMFGSLGYFDADLEWTFSLNFPTNPQRGSMKSSDSGVTVAGGIQYEWSRIALRGEYEWFDTDDIDSTAINVVVVFRF